MNSAHHPLLARQVDVQANHDPLVEMTAAGQRSTKASAMACNHREI